MTNLGSDDTPVKGENFSLPAGAQIDEDGGELVVRDTSGEIILRRDETAGNWNFEGGELQNIGSVNTEAAQITGLENPAARTPDAQHHVDFIDLQSGWEEVPDAFPTTFQEPFLMTPDGETFYLYYEERDENNNWAIGVMTSDDLENFDANDDTYPILSSTNTAGDPDRDEIADPTVLYLPWLDEPWRMIFDMKGDHDFTDYKSRSNWWSIGRATSTDGINWTKNTDGGGTTDVLLNIGERGTTYDRHLHNPASYLYNGQVYLITNDASHATTQDTGADFPNPHLWLPADPEGIGTDFDFYGQVLHHDQLPGFDVDSRVRINHPIAIGGTLYGTVNGGGDQSPFIASADGGRSWTYVADKPDIFGTSRLHSMLLVDGTLYGVPQRDSSIYKKEMFN